MSSVKELLEKQGKTLEEITNSSATRRVSTIVLDRGETPGDDELCQRAAGETGKDTRGNNKLFSDTQGKYHSLSQQRR